MVIVRDNLTGEILPPQMVRGARGEEIEFMLECEVWEEVPIAECRRKTGKGRLGGRWVDVNEGDKDSPNIRCRYVAKETAYQKSDDLSAAMPPLEASRMLVSHVATDRSSGKDAKKLMVLDARKAHLHAVPTRGIFVELPHEIRKLGICGRLKRCFFGTRNAPHRWEAYLSSELKRHGFLQGVASPCCFRHSTRDVKCVVHGDDFTFVASDEDLQWTEARMEESFMIKVVGKMGPDATDLKELRFLNRILRWAPDGVYYETDPRHAEILARDLIESCGPLVRPAGAKGTKEEEESSEALTGMEITRFRSGAARANYLSMDRADLSYATKELCRRMSAPRQIDWMALVRLIKYSKAELRLVHKYAWQQGHGLDVYADTDFADLCGLPPDQKECVRGLRISWKPSDQTLVHHSEGCYPQLRGSRTDSHSQGRDGGPWTQ